jgi:hypothetical protein
MDYEACIDWDSPTAGFHHDGVRVAAQPIVALK